MPIGCLRAMLVYPFVEFTIVQKLFFIQIHHYDLNDFIGIEELAFEVDSLKLGLKGRQNRNHALPYLLKDLLFGDFFLLFRVFSRISRANLRAISEHR